MQRPSRSTFLTALGAGLAVTTLPRLAGAQSAKLRIGGPLTDLFAEPYYLKDAGTFSRIGFDVDITPMPNASAVISALAGGSVDLGVSDQVVATSAIISGVPIQMLASCGLYRSTESTAMVAVAKNSSIMQPRDMEGKTLATQQLSGLSASAIHAWLTASGVDVSKVKIVEMPITVMAAAITRGTIDAAFLAEPFFTYAKADLRVLSHPLDAIGKEFVLSAWFATRPWIQADRDRAKRVVAAIYETGRWANAHRPETLAILAREGKMDLEQIRGIQRAPYATSLVLAQVQTLLTAAETLKLIDRHVDAGSIVAQL